MMIIKDFYFEWATKQMFKLQISINGKKAEQVRNGKCCRSSLDDNISFNEIDFCVLYKTDY